MFSAAYELAEEFTFPLVFMARRVNGQCVGGLGTCVLINADGWVVTSEHLVGAYWAWILQSATVLEYQEKRSAILDDHTLSATERDDALRNLIAPTALQFDRVDLFVGSNHEEGSRVEAVLAFRTGDIAVAKLKNFDRELHHRYAKFKNPDRPMRPGTSLCKIGFPLHEFTPTFNNDLNRFDLPPKESVDNMFCYFPLEGVFTRTKVFQHDPGHERPWPVWFLETSSPALKGQSGGPILDVNGTVWAIQSRNTYWYQRFEAPVPNSAPLRTVPQFVSFGSGCHVRTVLGFLKELGIEYHLADY